MKFSNNHKKLTALLFLISFGAINAQENITYEQALEKAFQQNGTLKKFKINFRISGKTERELLGYSAN